MALLGTADKTQKANPPKTAGELADIVLPDHEGNDVRLGDLWRDGPAVLVWVRHYGCTYCRAHAVQLNRDRSEIEGAGGRVVLIGQASPRQAEHFRRRTDVDLPVLADADRRSYRAAGAKIGTFTELLGPKVVGKGIVTGLRTGTIQGRTIGHPAQLGGAMVIRPDGTVAWSHMSDDASDNATAEEIVDALRSASAAARA